MLIVLAIVVPWYAALYRRDGWTYITSFIRRRELARFTEGVGVERRPAAVVYLPVVFSDSFPWSLFLFAGRGLVVRERADGAGNADDRDAFRIRTLLWLWILAIVGVLLAVGGEAGSLHLSRSCRRCRARRRS